MSASLAMPRPEITERLGRELGLRVQEQGASAEMLTVMRFEHPGMRFASCSENDIPARLPAWLTLDRVHVYLLDASEHCVSLTNTPERACGMLFAIVEDE